MIKIRLYLSPSQLNRFESGDAKFFIALVEELSKQGYSVDLGEQTDQVHVVSGVIEEYAIIQKALNDEANVFSIREFGHSPYATIENTSSRANFRLSGMNFENQNKNYKREYYWLYRRIFKLDPPLHHRARGEKVLVPLQGGLLNKRADAQMNSIEMLKILREHLPDRQIYIRPHPAYTYKEDELEALEKISRELDLKQNNGKLKDAINDADFLVGLNSTVHLHAMFYGRPSILFGGADFSHNCLSIYNGMDAKAAFEEISTFTPDYRAYLVWYFSQMILMWPKDGPQKVVSIMQDLGLPKVG